MKNYYKKGTWNVQCPVCGFYYKSEELKKRWDGLMVCQKDWEPRHPQDLLKTFREENGQLPFTYPVPDEPSIGPTYTIPLEPIPPGTFNNSL